MGRKLKESFAIQKLVSELGIEPTGDPVADILRYCGKRVKGFLAESPECVTLTELLEWIAAKVKTDFEEVHNDEDIEAIKLKYKDEALALIDNELSTNEDFGLTIRRIRREPYEPLFVSVIDCRGSKGAKSYFTKWHEIAHLLVLTQNGRDTFKRTHSLAYRQNAEENLMDKIASEFGFYEPICRPHVAGDLTFEAINCLREKLCPEASQQASLIGFFRLWQTPGILLRAEMALRKGDEIKANQLGFDFLDLPMKTLRAINVRPNNVAREKKFSIHENMRVPEKSSIYAVYKGDLTQADSEENLSWWETSKGLVFPSVPIRVQAKRAGDGVDAIISPIN